MQTNYYDLRDARAAQNEVDSKIAAAAAILRDGGLVAIPTETVYGLGANGLDPKAVEQIFQVKGRPQDNPLILHLAEAQWLERYCREIPAEAYRLAEAFWPGPLTMILKRKDMVPDVTTAGLDTVAVRCPDHPVTLAIIREAGLPIAAPSANLSGRPSCTTAQDVLEDMDGKIQGIVDGGPCAVGVESTILDLTCKPPRILRPGGLPVEEIEALLGAVEMDKAIVGALAEGEQPKAPGMKYRHYAPKAPVTVVTGAPEASAKLILQQVQPGDGVICFDEFASLYPQQVVQKLGRSEDKRSHAQRVFDALRAFDSSDATAIYAQCPDEKGLGLAVSNRLKKAAGFHVLQAENPKVVIGLTGGTGAGKSEALAAIERLGGTVIDCDKVYYQMLQENEAFRQEIGRQFPGTISPEGQLDRGKLGREVFASEEKLEALNQIVYRFIVPEVERQLQGNDLFAIDAINLMESGLGRLCQCTVAVIAPAERRVHRIMERDGITEEYARLRIAAQKSDEFYRSACDLELYNNEETALAFAKMAEDFFCTLIHKIRFGGHDNDD